MKGLIEGKCLEGQRVLGVPPMSRTRYSKDGLRHLICLCRLGSRSSFKVRFCVDGVAIGRVDEPFGAILHLDVCIEAGISGGFTV